MPRNIHASVLIGAALLGVTACATDPKAKDAKEQDQGDHAYVVPLGSHIPVKVKKGEAPKVTTAPTESISGEDAARTMRTAGGKPQGAP